MLFFIPSNHSFFLFSIAIDFDIPGLVQAAAFKGALNPSFRPFSIELKKVFEITFDLGFRFFFNTKRHAYWSIFLTNYW